MKRIASLLVALLLSNSAFAGNFSCFGIPQSLLTWKDGRVGVNLDTMNKIWILCNKTQNEGCNAILSNLLTAKARNSQVQIVILDNTYASCADIPSWTTISDVDYVVHR